MSLSRALGIVSGINEIGNFFQLFGSAVSYLRSRWNNREQEQQIQEYDVQGQQIQEHEVLQLQTDLQILNDTLPSMYNLIDRAEWKSHENFVAQLLPKLKDAVYEAEDLLDEFRWYEIKVSTEGNNSTQLSSLIEFFRSVIQGSFNKVTDIQKRLINLSSQLEKTGLREATPRFDKSVRPVTTSFPTKAKIFGREHEIQEVVRLLGVPNNSSSSSSKRKRTYNEANNELRAAFVPVLPIVGMGGVGKTTLAQEITTFPGVKSHFDKIIWICVSDEFSAEWLTKVLIKSLSGKEAVAENFDDLQRDLAHEVGKKRFLLILDDIWLDTVEEGGQNWMTFCAPLKNIHQESRLLVTTRFAEVAKIVGTKEYFGLEEYIELKGLEPEAFWNLFKLCVFGSKNSHIDPQLEMIGRSILPKLKGNPLAAVTIGRLLQKSLATEHWNNILNSELWQLQQNKTDILPALRLSYMYLPFHLKRCFSFCAVYPKDYNFQKARLAEMWVAEGFVEPQGDIPLQHIGDQYFEDLVNLSFFQKLRGKYVIHDLIHDMAQLVSKDECFIVKNTSDIEKIPQHVRLLSILTSSGLNFHHFSSLCKGKHKNLRTLICQKPLLSQRLASVMDYWVSEFQLLRAISLASTRQLPENIGNLKHLRYLEFSRACPFKSLPSSFCCLYNLQIVYARNCVFESLPTGFGKLNKLQKFETQFETNKMEVDALDCQRLLQFIGSDTKKLIICNLGAISKDHATKMGVRNLEYLDFLSLIWSSLRSQEHNETEVLDALLSPAIKTLNFKGYPSGYLPWGAHLCSLPTSAAPLFRGSDGTEENVNENEAPMVTIGSNNGRSGSILSSLTELCIEESEQLLSLEQFLQPDCVPAIKKVTVENCPRLSLKSAKIGDLCCLEELMVCDCPTIISRGVFSPYLKKLTLKEYRGNLKSILKLEMWSLPALLELTVIGFNSLTFNRNASLCHRNGSNSSAGLAENINQNEEHVAVVGRNNIGRTGSIFPSLTELRIEGCEQLLSLEQCLQPDCVPAIKKVAVDNCPRLSLKSAKIGDLCCLEELMVCDCPNITSQGVFSSYLKKLTLKEYRGNLKSILKLEMWSLPGLLELTIIGLNSLTFNRNASLCHQNGSNSSTGPQENINQNEEHMAVIGSNNIGRTGSIFPSLTELRIEGCEQLSNVEQFLQPDCVPAIKKIVLENCPRLSLKSAKVGDLCCLEELIVCEDCPTIISRGVISPYLKKLTLKESRNLGGSLMSALNIKMLSLPALLELTFSGLNSLAFITKANISLHSSSNSSNGTFSLLTDLTIQNCRNLMNIDGLLSHECLPAVRRICISYCAELQRLPSEQFGSFSSLTDLELVDCPRLNWQSRMVLPSSLHRLSLGCCGDISSWFPGCLDNLTSLRSLKIERLENVVCIPGHLWRNNLHSLHKLEIIRCPHLVSIGGPSAIARISTVSTDNCANLENIRGM